MNADEMIELQKLWANMENDPSTDTMKWNNVIQTVLMNDHKKTFKPLVRKALFQIVIYVVVLGTAVILTSFVPRIYQSDNLWLSVGMILPIYSMNFYWQIVYYLRLSKIDYTDTILTIKQSYCRLEMYKYRWQIAGCFFAPIVLFALYLLVPGLETSIWLIILMILLFQIRHNFNNINMSLKKVENEILSLSQWG